MSDLPPPGWYHDGAVMRWWDGHAWGAAGTPPPPNPDENDKMIALLSHGGSLFGGFILPLVIYIVSKDRGRQSFARHHAGEALNFQLTLMLAMFAPFLVFFVVFFASVAASSASSEPPAGLFIVIPLLWLVIMTVSIGGLVFSIIGMVKASRLERWRYPITIRFVNR